MIRKSIFDTPTTPRLSVFLQWVREGNLFIPDFQRPFEWDDERRLNLLDSVSRGLPIGAFMVWRTMRDDIRTYTHIGPLEVPQPKSGEVHNLLIDGHQRLTTFYAALEPLIPEQLELLRAEDNNWPVYFDLAAEDGEPGFVLASRRKSSVPRTWLPTNELFVAKALFRRQRELEEHGDTRMAERIEELSTAFKDYLVPVLPLVTENMKAVTDSFVRINIGGKRMAEDKVLRALTYTDYRIDEHIQELRSQLAEIGWGGLREQVFINALKARLDLDVYESDPSEIVKAIRGHGDKYREIMNGLGAGLRAAAHFISEECEIPGPAILPYEYQLICLSEALLRHSGSISKNIAAPVDPARLMVLPESSMLVFRWVWATTYTGYFTGMTGKQIRNTIKELETLLSPESNPSFPMLLDPRVGPLRSYRGSATRSKALVLCMARAIVNDDFRMQVQRRLGLEGASAVDRIFPEHHGTASGNLIVTVPEKLEAIRFTLSFNPRALSKELAEEHFISDAALDTLAVTGDPSLFCQQRATDLIELENRFVTSLGLMFDPDRDD